MKMFQALLWLLLGWSAVTAHAENASTTVVIAHGTTEYQLSLHDFQGVETAHFPAKLTGQEIQLTSNLAANPQLIVSLDRTLSWYSPNGQVIHSLPVANFGHVALDKQARVLFSPQTTDLNNLYLISDSTAAFTPVLSAVILQSPAHLSTIDIDNDGVDEVAVGTSDDQVLLYRANGEKVKSFKVFSSTTTRRSVREKTTTPGKSCDNNGNGTPTHCETPAPETPVMSQRQNPFLIR